MRLPPTKNTEKGEEAEEEPNKNQVTGGSAPLSMSLNEISLKNGDNVIIVLGSESSGISTNLKEVTTHNVYIPPLLNKEMANKHPFNIIDSLNVGVSAGIIINHLKAQLKGSEGHTINNLH